jgi:hypothetical protein
MAAPSFIPAGQSTALAFHDVHDLAVWLLRQRPGRRLDLLPQDCHRGEGAPFPVVAVFALKPRDPSARQIIDDTPVLAQGGRPRLQDDWLGWAAGDDACDPEILQAALDRARNAGGLAA